MMGFEDREYSQDHSWQTSWGSDTPTTKRLLIITVLVFFAQSLFIHKPVNMEQARQFESLRISYVDEWLTLDAAKALQGQVWRVISYGFCHDRQNAFSLVFNMLLLWFLGRRLERMYGSREFLFYYLTATVAAGALFVGIGAVTPLPYPLTGSNPAIMALFALYAFHFPRDEILLFWLIPVQIYVLLIIYVAVDILTVLQAMQQEVPWAAAAHTVAHLSGAGFAYLYKHFDWHLSGFVVNASKWRMVWKRAVASRRLRVYQPAAETEELDGKVDAILAKIHEHGSESLTDSERALLARASDKYKKRT